MGIEILTTLNLLFFFASLTLLYLAKRNGKSLTGQAKESDEDNDTPDASCPQTSDQRKEENANKILKIYQGVVTKIERIRNMHISASQKVENATESSIQQLSSLINRLETTTGKTAEILEMMRKKISLSIVQDTVGKKCNPEDADAIREKYELMLKEVLDQLSLIIQQKQEDVGKLDDIKERINSAADGIELMARSQAGDSQQKLASAKELEEKLRAANTFIETSVFSLKEAIDVESRFIYSTIFLLQDLVLALVSSFVQLNTIMDNTLGQSSSVEDELNTIIVNLQCEDICKEIFSYTLEILSAMINDLHELKIDGLSEEDFIRIDEKEKAAASEVEDLNTEEEVTFF